MLIFLYRPILVRMAVKENSVLKGDTKHALPQIQLSLKRNLLRNSSALPKFKRVLD